MSLFRRQHSAKPRLTLPAARGYNINCVGESSYTPALLELTGSHRNDDDCEDTYVDVRLARDTKNRTDQNAVAVFSAAGRKLAYLSSEDAADLHLIIERLSKQNDVWAEARIGGYKRDDDIWIVGIQLSLGKKTYLL